MDTQQIANRWTALVFGAVFNFVTYGLDGSLIVYAIKTLIGGAVWLIFQIIADRMKRRSEEAAQKQQNKTQDNGAAKMDSADSTGK